MQSVGIMRSEPDNTYSTNRFIIWAGGPAFAAAGSNAVVNLSSGTIHNNMSLEYVISVITTHRYNDHRIITCPLEIQLLGLNEQYDRAIKEAMETMRNR